MRDLDRDGHQEFVSGDNRFAYTGRLRGQTTDPSPGRFFAHVQRFLRRTGYPRR